MKEVLTGIVIVIWFVSIIGAFINELSRSEDKNLFWTVLYLSILLLILTV